jgi:DNA-directed RNA polymerase specialized sigma24 family protein
MDLQTEKIFKEQAKEDPRQFLPLFDEDFSVLYRYVARRVQDENIREQIARLAFLDAVGQMSTCPSDVNFSTWLFSIAKKRVQEYVKGGVSGPAPEISSPIFSGASVTDGVYDDEFKLKQQAETFFSALTFEEREIVKLKFFEELTDGEVMYVLGISGGVIGPKIYQVLKRGYEILFGKIDDYTGVYYGELHSFLARLKDIEKIPVPDVLKLKLRVEIKNKVEKMYTEKFERGEAEGESDEAGKTGFEERKTGVDVGEKGAESDETGRMGFEGKKGMADAENPRSGEYNGMKLDPDFDPFKVGSKDPAKTFVYAAKGMSRGDVEEVTQEYVGKQGGDEIYGSYETQGEAVTHDDYEKHGGDEAGESGVIAEHSEYGDIGVLRDDHEKQVPVSDFGYEKDIGDVSYGSNIDEVVPVHFGEDSGAGFDEDEFSFAKAFSEIWERWKSAILLIPSGIFVAVVLVVLGTYLFGKSGGEGVTGLPFDVDYGSGFEQVVFHGKPDEVSDYKEKFNIENNLIVKIAEGKEVKNVKIEKSEIGEGEMLDVEFLLKGGDGLDYTFSESGKGDYRVKSFKKVEN